MEQSKENIDSPCSQQRRKSTQDITTPTNRPNTRSRTSSSGDLPQSTTHASEKRKRSPNSQLVGNMSKKNTAENDPTNAQIMRAITNMSARFDKLPTVEHLNKLEADLHNKLENNNKALKQELRSEFKSEMKAQADKMNDMIADVKAQINNEHAGLTTAIKRNDNQQGRYLRARRSFKIWPVTKGQSDRTLEESVRRFFIKLMLVPTQIATSVKIDNIRHADQAKNSKVTSEVVVEFADVDGRDSIKSYASGLAIAKGAAGLRLDIPPCLKGSFKILNEHGISMVKIYGKEVKRNIKFDDTNQDLMMDIKLPTSTTWHNITIQQATEARRVRESIDMQNIRQVAVGGASAINIDQDKARALMLSISPQRVNAQANFKSATGVVHINSEEDWRNFEGEERDTTEHDDSVEEILRGTRRGQYRGSSSQQS